MKFGERLQQSRINLNLTQQDIANEMHVSRQTISSWERGNSYPDINSLVNLSDYYQVSLDVLLKEDSGMKEYLEKKEVEKSIKPIIISLLIIDLLFLLLLILQGLRVIQLNSQAVTILFIFGGLNAIGLLQLSSFQIKINTKTKKSTFRFKKTWILLVIGITLLLGGTLYAYLTPQDLAGGIISGTGLAILALYLLIKIISKAY